jgi:hypothetical protein
MVFTTRLSGGRGVRNGLERELRRLGVRQKNGKPNHRVSPDLVIPASLVSKSV